MTDDLKEKIARAICKSRTCEGINCCQWPCNMSRRINCPVDKGGYDDAAKDALTAIEEAGYVLVPRKADTGLYCSHCDMEHQLHEDEIGFHHVIKGERVECVSYADLSDSATTFDPDNQFTKDNGL